MHNLQSQASHFHVEIEQCQESSISPSISFFHPPKKDVQTRYTKGLYRRCSMRHVVAKDRQLAG